MPNATQAAPQPQQQNAWVDPYRAYNFKIEIQGVTQGHFTECSAAAVKVHPIRYREGGAAQIVHVMPGPIEYSNIRLKYGLTSSQDLWTWLMTAVQGRVERKNVSILLLDADGTTEVMRWNLISAWPSEWRGTMLDALNREAAIAELELVYERLELG
jgi:phage tail-like protein